MKLSYWIFLVALTLSTIAAYYSILGLVTIFSAAALPVIIMATAMEISKVSITVWLHRYWSNVQWTMRLYLVPAIVILMLITSMGIFGLLSKAHTGQAAENSDIAARVAIFDEKIKTEKENIDTARQALTQMNASVDQTLARSTSEGGASRAVQVRKSQSKERQSLQNDISKSQDIITKLQEERAPIAAQLRHAEAEVGPIKYVAALIYGENTDAGTLEKAVRFVIIMLVIVFDPLAIFMVLAANESIRWEKEKSKLIPESEEPKEVKDHTMDSVEFTEMMEQHIQADEQAFNELEERVDHIVERVELAVDLLHEDHTKLKTLDETVKEHFEADENADSREVEEKLEQIWEKVHPGFTTEEHRQLYEMGLIDYLPWKQREFVKDALTGKFDEMDKKD